jgi:hypothetical protein
MSELKNSQRISYKATYVQTKFPGQREDSAPPAQESGTRIKKRLKRAVEKTAYAHALQMPPDETNALRKKIAAKRMPAKAKKSTLAALRAITRLGNDASLTSTLNNAKYFAHISPETIIQVGRESVGYKSEVLRKASATLERISREYELSSRADKAPPHAPPGAPPPTLPAKKKPAGKEFTTTVAGMPVRVFVASPQPPRRRTRGGKKSCPRSVEPEAAKKTIRPTSNRDP